MASTVQWWIVLTTSTNPSGQPGSGYIIVQGTQQEVYAKYGGPSDVKGPYPTRAKAQEAAQKGVGPGPGNISNTPPGQPQAQVPGVSGLAEIGAVLQAFFEQLTRVEMWRSLGWIVLGVALMGIGAYMWLTKEGVAPSVIPLPI